MLGSNKNNNDYHSSNTQNEKPKKKSPLVGLFIFVILIALIFVMLIELYTYNNFDVSKIMPSIVNEKLYTFFKLEDKKEEDETKANNTSSQDSDDTENVVSKTKKTESSAKTEYYSRYAENNITLTKNKIERGDKNLNGTAKIEANFYQIDGLVYQNVEDNINKELKEYVSTYIGQVDLNDDEVDYTTIDTKITGNYANILSGYVCKTVYYVDGETNPESTYTYFNFRLDNGDQVDFYDLFTSDANIALIVNNELYQNFAWTYIDSVENTNKKFDSNDIRNYDYSTIENKMANALRKFDKDDILFTISESYITIYLGEEECNINMLNNYKYMNVFNIVKQETSLFDDGEKDQRGYAFRNCPGDLFIALGNISENKYLSVFNSYDASYYSDDNEDSIKATNVIASSINSLTDCLNNYSVSGSQTGVMFNINQWSYDGCPITYNYKDYEVAFVGQAIQFTYADATDFTNKIDTIYSKCEEAYQKDNSEFSYDMLDFSSLTDYKLSYFIIVEENNSYKMYQLGDISKVNQGKTTIADEINTVENKNTNSLNIIIPQNTSNN